MRVIKIWAMAEALQRTNGARSMTGLSFRHGTEWRHANNRRREVRRGSKSGLPVGRKQSDASEETSSLDPWLWKKPARGNNFCKRIEGRVGKIRGWRRNVEKKPSRENGKMQNNQGKQKALGRQENLVGLQRLRKKRGSKQSSSAWSSATEKSEATSTISGLVPAVLPRALAHSWTFSSHR